MANDGAVVVGPASVDHGLDGVGSDAAESGLVARAHMFGLSVARIATYRLVHVQFAESVADQDAALEELANSLLVDPIGQWWSPAGDHDALADTDGIAANDSFDRDRGVVIETGLRPGVTDREGAELVRAAGEIGIELVAATVGNRYAIESSDADLDVGELARRVLHNDVIERWAEGSLPPAFADLSASAPATQSISLDGLDADGLAEVNKRRRLGLDPEEMVEIQRHFGEIGRAPTDAELETLAQTWSEHCAHKTFRASISVSDGSEVDGLLKSLLRAATDTIDAPWVRSAFVDNAGIVRFDDDYDIAIKAETHNHPSALEPFGGSNTGVGGVVRDILGVSAKPIAVSDILCFGPTEIDPSDVPEGVLHPKRIREGVVAGVGDYGNKIGVPNIAGAIVHDPAYTTTPLVFAGCLGLLPNGSNPTEAAAGDSIVVFGGAVGRDGVGGATFSSQTMAAETAEVAGSSVQIGDPIVEKGLIDVIVAARNARLYTAVTDCGAGGLSSAVGEMAEKLGAEVDLQMVPRKYPGLAPWEVWLSEAQERMVVASPDPEPLLELAERWGVGAAVIGTFTGDGRLLVRDGDATLIDIDCEFLHDGRPRRQMTAIAPDTARSDRQGIDGYDPASLLLQLLAHPSIRSNEDVVRTFDHEVLGGSVVRPYGGAAGDGAADGTAMVPPGTSGERAVAIGIGVNALLGDIDAEAMAWHVIDEAVRNVVLAGADPKELSLLDNFAWGDPTDPETLGTLVAACRGCHDYALLIGAPFVSGKDSLYNVFVGPDGSKDPVAPTLVISAVGIVKDLDVVPVTGLLEAGDDIWLVGPTAGALGGSHLDDVLGSDHGGSVPRPDPVSVARHHDMAIAISAGLVRSAHDVSDGGLAVAAAEWALAGRLGLDLDVETKPEVLFGEGSGRYLVEVSPTNRAEFERLVPWAKRIGEVTAEPTLALGVVSLTLDDVAAAWNGHVDRGSLANAERGVA